MAQRILQVCMGDAGIVVGTLRFTAEAGREHSSFQYAQSWLEHSHRFAISPSLTLDDTQKFFHGDHFAGGGSPLPPPVADTTPDSWGREILVKDARQRKQDVFTEADFLVASDDFSRIGALRFRDVASKAPFLACGAGGAHAIPPLLHLHQISMDVTRMEAGDPTAMALARLREAGGSLGGARPKCSILDTDGRLSIAKFTSRRDKLAVERAEVMTLRLARLCGITTPESRIEMSEGLPVAIIERFDRATNQRRIPFISAQTMLNASKATGGTYVDLADAIRQYSASANTELHDLFRRIAFNILVSNTDDHLKNHGFLYDGKGGWRMAPAYDINPSPQRQKTLKTAIADPQDPSASLDLLLEHAFYFEMSEDDAIRTMSHMAETIESHWEYLAKDTGMTRAEIHAYRDAFDHDAARFALALSSPSSGNRSAAASLEQNFHDGLLPAPGAIESMVGDDGTFTCTVRALVKDANTNVFALVETDGKTFAVPVSDLDRDRLAIGHTATFRIAESSRYCAVMLPSSAATTEAGETPGPRPGTETRVPGF